MDEGLRQPLSYYILRFFRVTENFFFVGCDQDNKIQQVKCYPHENKILIIGNYLNLTYKPLDFKPRVTR